MVGSQIVDVIQLKAVFTRRNWNMQPVPLPHAAYDSIYLGDVYEAHRFY